MLQSFTPDLTPSLNAFTRQLATWQLSATAITPKLRSELSELRDPISECLSDLRLAEYSPEAATLAAAVSAAQLAIQVKLNSETPKGSTPKSIFDLLNSDETPIDISFEAAQGEDESRFSSQNGNSEIDLEFVSELCLKIDDPDCLFFCQRRLGTTVFVPFLDLLRFKKPTTFRQFLRLLLSSEAESVLSEFGGKLLIGVSNLFPIWETLSEFSHQFQNSDQLALKFALELALNRPESAKELVFPELEKYLRKTPKIHEKSEFLFLFWEELLKRDRGTAHFPYPSEFCLRKLLNHLTYAPPDLNSDKLRYLSELMDPPQTPILVRTALRALQSAVPLMSPHRLLSWLHSFVNSERRLNNELNSDGRFNSSIENSDWRLERLVEFFCTYGNFDEAALLLILKLPNISETILREILGRLYASDGQCLVRLSEMAPLWSTPMSQLRRLDQVLLTMGAKLPSSSLAVDSAPLDRLLELAQDEAKFESKLRIVANSDISAWGATLSTFIRLASLSDQPSKRFAMSRLLAKLRIRKLLPLTVETVLTAPTAIIGLTKTGTSFSSLLFDMQFREFQHLPNADLIGVFSALLAAAVETTDQRQKTVLTASLMRINDSVNLPGALEESMERLELEPSSDGFFRALKILSEFPKIEWSRIFHQRLVSTVWMLPEMATPIGWLIDRPEILREAPLLALRLMWLIHRTDPEWTPSIWNQMGMKLRSIFSEGISDKLIETPIWCPWQIVLSEGDLRPPFYLWLLWELRALMNAHTHVRSFNSEKFWRSLSEFSEFQQLQETALAVLLELGMSDEK